MDMIAAPTPAYVSGNRVLDALAERDRVDLEADLEILTVTAHQSTQFVGTTMQHVDFPINAVLSVVVTLDNGDTVEVGTVGNEGFVESDAALDATSSLRTAFCQVRGVIGRMPIARFEARMAGTDGFGAMMRRNVRAILFSAQQYAACNVKHSILQRCARWLAMTADRVGENHFTLTHDFLAIMLGVRRSGVSEAADKLQKLGAISYHRGAIVVRDRALLDHTACECYEACKVAFTASLTA
jgi:CRP-like cAMP-binding protein